MGFNPSSPVTGGAQTGLTSPTFTLTSDTPPDSNAKQFAVTALGGTQSGVLPHSVSSPFTVAAFRPKLLLPLPVVDPSGVLRRVPRNNYRVVTRHGVVPLAGQAYDHILIRTSIEVPAGVDSADPTNMRSALSLHFGVLFAESSDIGDLVATGIL